MVREPRINWYDHGAWRLALGLSWSAGSTFGIHRAASGEGFGREAMAYVVGRIEIKRLGRSSGTDEYHVNYVQKKISQ
jgi:hypothetical protein